MKYRDANIRSNWYYSIFFPVVEILFAICMALLVWYGCKRILNDQQMHAISASPNGITRVDYRFYRFAEHAFSARYANWQINLIPCKWVW
jgi:hypothetical protein